LMDRKPVREPKGWDDTPPSNDVEVDVWGKGESGTSIGDAAEQG